MSFISSFFSKGRVASNRGFTLIELLVSIAIIGIITGLVVFNHNDLTDEISVSNVANDISLQVRTAQVYGISVRELKPSSNQFFIAYGEDFNIANTGFFYAFADGGTGGTQNGYYDTPASCVLGSSECLSQNYLTRGNTLFALCEIPATGSEVCSPTVSRIDVSFLRPDPSALFTFFNAGGSIVSYPSAIGADIQVKSPKGLIKHVYIYKTGQISVP